ncbi:hypothetical protein D3C72_2093440 [compost metagenome]
MVPTARAFILSPLTRDRTTGIEAMSTSTCPPAMALNAAAAPPYGTVVVLMPVACFNCSTFSVLFPA